MKLVAALACLGAASARPSSEHNAVEKMFESWAQKFSMEFEGATEYLHRLAIFAENVERIESHNMGNHSFTMGMNQFGHLTSGEFKSQISSPMPEAGDLTCGKFDGSSITAAKSVDWTTKGAVTPVKNQGQCGSCWAFSTTGSTEGAYFLKNNDLKSFSEQQLVDCDKVDQGCNGGLMDQGFAFVAKNKGLCAEADYAYTGKGGKCNTKCSVVAGSAIAKCTDVSPVPQQTPATVESMAKAVSQRPVSVAIEADEQSFQFYKSGVLMGAKCGATLDHGVLVVGYGTEDGTDYWKVKNSWATTWGDAGYLKIEKDAKSNDGKGACGVLLAASFPEL